jgi:Tol biopolymer transport system component
MFNDLWVLELATRKARPLRVVQNSPDCGVLGAHFSPDGKHLSWSEMYERPARGGKEFGWWWLMVADVEYGKDGPTLTQVRQLQPGGPAFYECHGFSPDGSKLIYTSNALTPGMPMRQREDITVYDLAFDSERRLTSEGYNEHAVFRPDGQKIVFATDTDDPPRGTGRQQISGTDYWMMDPDGSHKQRLTSFNVPGSPMYTANAVVVAGLAWNRDGTAFVCYCHTGLLDTAEGMVEQVLMIKLGAAK